MGVFNMEDKTIKPLFPKHVVHPLFPQPVWIPGTACSIYERSYPVQQ